MAMLFHTTADFSSIFMQPLHSEKALGILTLLTAVAAIALQVAGKISKLTKRSQMPSV
jgi:hypothetical protein